MNTTTNRLIHYGFLIAVATLSTAAHANDNPSQRDGDSALSQWENVALYEPCMNGGVSAGGLYPSQIAEDKSHATLGILAQ